MMSRNFFVVSAVVLTLGAQPVVDFQMCDRQCRYEYGFYDRTIVGTRVGVAGHSDALGRHCRCSSTNGTQIGEMQPRTSLKPWDDHFWCGNFSSSLVCALNPGSDVGSTIELAQAQSEQRTILHCGMCAACSNLHDLNVLSDTKTYITRNMTMCAADFAKPKILGGNQDLDTLVTCLHESNIDFSTDGRSWAAPKNSPTCMDCWTDNIMCDAVNCKWNFDCIKKFFDPDHSGTLAGCLKCDEENCGPEFIKCAGANRRSTGIVSDIKRPEDQDCKHGFYSGK